MSGLKGIAKNLGASFGSHLVVALQQVVLTPLFLRNYGEAGFGEWQVLSAAVSYLGTLDFGIQTFVNQDLTLRYHRRDMENFHIHQSTALRLLLGICTVAALLSASVFIMPLEHWLKMDGSGGNPPVSAFVVRGAIFSLAMIVLSNIMFGFFMGQFMILGRSHIGQTWQNIKYASQILISVPFLIEKASFLTIAAAQLIALLICLIGVIITLFRIGRDIFPTLRYWDSSIVGSILRPSAYFGLILSSNFLVYQVPVLILQRAAGPVAVSIFTTSRTIFSMTRNVLNSFTQAIGPEVTMLFAKEAWPKLGRLYDYSERAVFAIIPIANIGTLFLCPLLTHIWLHKPDMFKPMEYVLLAGISIVMAAKEHKYQFQVSTNTHRELARFMFGTYAALVAIWWYVVPIFQMKGLILAWLAVEVLQVLYIMHLNAKFFAGHYTLGVKYPVRLALLSVAFLCVTLFFIQRTALFPLPEQVLLAVGSGMLILGLDIPIFGLRPVWGSVQGRLMQRFAR